MARLDFAQKAFIVVKGELLMVRRGKSDALNPHRWEVPGGRMIPGERLDDAIRREVLEEVSIDIEPGPVFALWSWKIPATDALTPSTSVIAAGRLCRAANPMPNLIRQSNGEDLDTVAWVPLNKVLSMDLIPNSRDAFQKFSAITRSASCIYAEWIC